MNQFRPLIFLFGLLLPCLLPGQKIRTTEWEQVVPSAGLPEQVTVQPANNNLDLIRFQDRFYLAFRSAPNHFASKKTQLFVVSSSDLENWQFETQFHLDYDMREPRFFALGDSLFFYFFEAGKHPLQFEPRHLWGTVTAGDGEWAEKWDSGLDGYVPWRFRSREGLVYMSGYYGKHLYRGGHEADLRLFSSPDGRHWQKISDSTQVGGKNAEEGAFVFDDEGNLWGTVRMESTGAYVVYAHRDSLQHWHKKYTRWKYDSALLFNHHNDIYLISRRNLDGDGRMDRAWRWLPYRLRKGYNLVRYSLTRKTTALWKINKEELLAEHIMDFPSTGDCAFPGIAPLNDSTYVLMNYSSDIQGPKKNWIRGQLGRTYIYRTLLTFGKE